MELKDCFSTEDLKIGKDDIVNIATSQYEENIEIELEENESLLVKEKKNLKDAKKSFEVETKKFIDIKTTENTKKAVDAMSKMGVVYVPKVRGLHSEDRDYVHFCVTFSVNSSLRDIGTYTSQEFSIRGEISSNKAIKSSYDKIEAIKEEIKTIELNIDENRDALNNMESFIRKSRAKLTKNLMMKYSDGDDIVQALLESVQGTQKRLK